MLMKKTAVEKLQDLLLEYGKIFYGVFDWDLTEEEQERMKKSEIGEEVHIETPMIPVVLDEGEGNFIGMYSDEKNIPEEFIRKKAVQNESIEDFIVSCKVSSTVLKDDVMLTVNPYSENNVEYVFTMDEIDEIFTKLMKKEGDN